MLANSNLDDRIAIPHRRNRLNFSGALLDSSHVATIENLSVEIDEWNADQLLDFARTMIE
ncbi:hypothetical protein H6F61_11585 [Cyanobacteria bacterium FACHB-472]|nr:hypothetical protein [Cyanobacteria bacterium FACHB-472]